jgi:tetratricopeptide (TPR) repeat protein
LNDNKGAVDDFSKAIELKSDYSDAYCNRGSAKYYLKDYKGACDDWQKALNLNNIQAKMLMQQYCKKI